jgi:hypothetical protein
LKVFRYAVGFVIVLWLPAMFRAQERGKFIQAELQSSIKAAKAKPGEPVRLKTTGSVTLPDGLTVSRGVEIYGEITSADAHSLAMVFDHIEIDGAKKPVKLSIRAAMMPGSGDGGPSGAVQSGAVIGLKGVTLILDDGPRHAAKFESTGKDLHLRSGLQIMLEASPPAGQ